MYNHDFSERTLDDELVPQRSMEDKKFVKLAEESIRKLDNYEVGIPLRDADQKFPNNRPLAEKRACHLKSKFGRNEEFRKEYSQAINTNIAKGYAEEVPEEELHRDNGKVWYLPHHGVRHPQKHKLRVVFDCAATYKGISLNQRLLQGPDLTNSLVGVLIRFRESNVAITSDIEGMFNQVTVPYDQRDLLRFLWWSEGDTTQSLTEYRMKTHLFGATSPPSCVNYVLRHIADTCDIDNYGENVADCIRRNFYVDDCLKSTLSEEEALSLVSNLRAVLKQGGFNLTKWTSNSRRVLESIPVEDRAQGVRNIEFQDALPVERALGVLWCPQTDSFGFQVNLKNNPTTRRGILSVLSSFYDPLGFIASAILPARTILQDLCKLKLGWDEKIPSEHETKWQRWLTEIPRISDLKMPRCFVSYDFGTLNTVQLHHFSDASELGYGTVSYLRFINLREEVHCSLVTSKSRVAPLKQVTIPRLELTAATVAVKVNVMIQKELDFKVDETFYWTDSTTVLQYINNEAAKYKTFVANRLSIIREGSNPSQWSYIATSENPADDNSRGQSVDKFLRNKRYHNAPDFLWKDQDQWPVTSLNQNITLESDPEVKQLKTGAIKVNETTVDNDILGELLSHYSDWIHLLREVAWWLRLKKILLNKIRQSRNQDSTGRRSLTADELMEAETAIIKVVQQKSFPQELNFLQMTKKDSNSDTQKPMKSAIVNLDPILQDGLLKVGGRLRNAPIPVSTKHQIILPKNNHVSNLIIRYVHEHQVNHQGRNHVMAELRRKYWIVKANTEVRKIVKRCVICRKYYAKAGNQKMADLPADRVTPEEPAFTRTGVDYFGPLMVKIGRTTRKRYGVLFTCLASRAVHLEVAGGLDTSSCISAIRRFMARRGPVLQIRSDNGTNFVGANAELKQAFKQLDQEQIERFTSNHGIKWCFNPPAASHHGGVWERQIRTVRKILQSILKTQFLKTCHSEEQLSTLLCEVETTINSRPLTRSSDDPGDLAVITSNDLLLLRPNKVDQPGVFIKTDIYAKKRWLQMQYLANLFCHRWIKEYLPDLQQRQKWLQPHRNLKEGDIVLVVEDNLPRNTWIMGKVLEVFPDKKGFIRQAFVKTPKTTLHRPIDKLCLLLEAEC